MYPYRFGRNADILHIDTVRKGFNTYRRDVGWNRHLFQSLTPCKSIISHVTQSLSQNHRIQITASPEGIRINAFHGIRNHHQFNICIVFKSAPADHFYCTGERHILICSPIFDQCTSVDSKIGSRCRRIYFRYRKLHDDQCHHYHQDTQKTLFSFGIMILSHTYTPSCHIQFVKHFTLLPPPFVSFCFFCYPSA